MDYNVNEIVVTIDGKDVQLNWEQLKQIREQFRMQDAFNVLDSFGNINLDIIDKDTLLKIGNALEDAIYDDTCDIEYAIVDDFLEAGLIIRIDEDEEEEEMCNTLFYYGNSIKEALSNEPIEITTVNQLNDYEDNYTFVIPADEIDDYADEENYNDEDEED